GQPGQVDGAAAGVGAAQAGADHRQRPAGVPGRRRAGRGGVVVEAVVEDAGVQDPGQVGEHGAQPGRVSGDAGQVAEVAADAAELGVDPGGCTAAAAGAVVPVA